MNPVNTQPLGVTPEELEIVRSILSSCDDAWLFGSRVKGTHKPFSDLDICIRLNPPDKEVAISELREAFQESALPYKVDLVDVDEISDDFQQLIRDSCRSLTDSPRTPMRD